METERVKLLDIVRNANLRQHTNRLRIFKILKDDEHIGAGRISVSTTIPVRKEYSYMGEFASFEFHNIKDLDMIIEALKILRREWEHDILPKELMV